MCWREPDGSVKKVIVSSWLKNPGGQQELADQGELENIQNVKGEESYRIDADNMRIWDAQGKDIYYQGTTDKALPVDVIIRYTLDGRSISAEDLAGKSGRVTIRFDYRNQGKGSDGYPWGKGGDVGSLRHAYRYDFG